MGGSFLRPCHMFEFFKITCRQDLWFSETTPIVSAFLSFWAEFFVNPPLFLHDFVQIRDIHDRCVPTCLSLQIWEEC